MGSSRRSWLPQSASLVAQLTPCLPTPAPAFDPSDKWGTSSMLDGEEGLRKVPRGSRGWVHALRQLFCQSSSTGCPEASVHLICSPCPSLGTSFVPDNLLASHQPLEVLAGSRAMDVMGSGSSQRNSQHGTRGWQAAPLQDCSSLHQSKAKAEVFTFPWPPGPSCHGDVSS